MRVDSTHLVPADQVGAVLPALLAAAAAGRASHIVRDRQVVANLVPVDALVVTADVEDALLQPAVRAEARRFAAEIESAGYQHAGNAIGTVLGWLWESSSAAAVRWIARYATELTDALTARQVGRPPFDPFWKAVGLALTVALTDDAIRDFEGAVRARPGELASVFSTAELTGQGRHRDDDDPWPDVTARGRCFAKKRFSDVAVGDFVPSHRGADLDYDDGWCRVEELRTGQVVLRDADGQNLTQPVEEPAAWWPTRSREPWQWGVPLDRR